MTPITIEIEIDRAAAILAGKAQFGKTTVAIDPGLLTPDQREEMVCLRANVSNGTLFLPRAQGQDVRYESSVGYTTPIVEPTQDTIAKALDEHRARRIAYTANHDAWKAKEEQERRDSLEKSAREWIEYPVRSRLFSNRIGGLDVLLPPYVERDRLPADLQSAWDAAIAEAQTEATRLNAAAKARAEATQQAAAEKGRIRVQSLATFLAEHGTEVQKKRRAANLMPDEEILDLVRNHVFSPLEHLPRYERMKKSDFSAADVSFEASNAVRATDAQYEAMEAIKSLVPGSDVTLREHVATVSNYDGEDETYTRLGYLVSIDWNGWPLSREYAA